MFFICLVLGGIAMFWGYVYAEQPAVYLGVLLVFMGITFGALIYYSMTRHSVKQK
jgi:uncharacterized membrane protein AbrB (regulator of aidB expression)